MESFSFQELNVDELIRITGKFGVLQAICFAYNCIFVIYAGWLATVCIFSGMQPDFACSNGLYPKNKCFDNCTSYKYLKPEGTMVAQFNLACGSRSLLNTLFTSGYWIGFLIGVLLTGYLLDKFGRKLVTIVNVAGLTIFSFLMYFGNDIYLLIFIRAMVGFFVSGTQLVAEYLPSKHIASVSLFIEVIFALGEMTAMVMGYIFKEDWKMQYLAAALPGPFLLLGSIVFAASIVYYGLTYGVQGLSGSIYINSFLMSLVEIPAFFAYILTNRYGRKYTTIAFLCLSGIAVIIMPFLKHVADGKVAVVLSMLGKLGSTAVFDSLYFYQIELFPSAIRGTALGICSMSARIAVISAPFIAKLGSISDYIPYIIFAIPTFVAAILILFFVPETNKKNLPESFDDVFAKYDPKHKRSRYYSRLSIRSTDPVIN